jgi:hypothetical protein
MSVIRAQGAGVAVVDVQRWRPARRRYWLSAAVSAAQPTVAIKRLKS